MSRYQVIVDVESAPLPNASDYFEPVEADKRLTDPVKVAASIEERRQAQLDKASLDYNCARIGVLGYWSERDGFSAVPCPDQDAERLALQDFWNASRHSQIVGFRCKSFDLPLMIQRSRYLGVEYPDLDLGKYSRSKSMIDLFDILTFHDSQRDFVMRRTLHQFCRRFQIPVADTTTGAEMPKLIAEGRWPEVRAHCLSDLQLTLELARKLRAVPEHEDALAAIQGAF
jgi:hypothetical protein